MNEKKTAETKADKVWNGLSQLDDKYFLEEYHPSYFKVKEGMEEDHNKLRDAMEFITDTEEETADSIQAIDSLTKKIAELMHENERLKDRLKNLRDLLVGCEQRGIDKEKILTAQLKEALKEERNKAISECIKTLEDYPGTLDYWSGIRTALEKLRLTKQ